MNNEQLPDIPLASCLLGEDKRPTATAPKTALSANGKDSQPDTNAEAQISPTLFKYVSVWGDVAAEPGPVYLLVEQLSLPYYDEIPASTFQAVFPELMLQLEFESLWSTYVHTHALDHLRLSFSLIEKLRVLVH